MERLDIIIFPVIQLFRIHVICHRLECITLKSNQKQEDCKLKCRTMVTCTTHIATWGLMLLMMIVAFPHRDRSLSMYAIFWCFFLLFAFQPLTTQISQTPKPWLSSFLAILSKLSIFEQFEQFWAISAILSKVHCGVCAVFSPQKIGQA